MFEPGRIYRRAELHHEYGGAKRLPVQGGILTPRGQPFIVLVTGDTGQLHGFHDFEDDEGVYHYYGTGQGDMSPWQNANHQIWQHAELGKDIHLFQEAPGGLRYRGQYLCGGYYETPSVPNRAGVPRLAIVFQLVPIADAIDVDDEPAPAAGPRTGGGRWTMSLGALRDRAGKSTGTAGESKTTKRLVRERSADVKVYVRRRAGGVCEGCGQPAPFVDKAGRPYLEPHHTRRLSDGGPDDIHHVIGLCPACHRRVHHGADGDDYNEELIDLLKALEPATAS